jgi:hypothetical protein
MGRLFQDPAGVSVLVCRGCCCGRERKHPGVDHAGQVDDVRAALPVGGQLWEVECLGACERSNVVVVRSAGHRRWFGPILDEPITSALATWLSAGAPGDPPEPLLSHEFAPPAVDV